MANITRPQALPTYSVLSPQSAVLRSLRAARGVWLGLAAWGVALAGLALVPGGEPGRAWALPLEALAGALGILAWGHLRPAPGLAPAVRGAPLVTWDRARVLRLIGIGLVVWLVGVAQVAFLADPQAPFGWAGLLWLASMALLVAVTARWPARPMPPAPPIIVAATPAPSALPVRRAGATRLPIAAPTLPTATPQSSVLSPQSSAPPWTRWEGAVFAGLVALAVVLRVWDLQNIPFAIHPDEILIGQTSVEAYLQGHTAPFFSVLWPNADLPAVWFLGVATSLKLGGLTLAALRLPGALFGAATVVPLYGFIRGTWGRAAAIAGAALCAGNLADIHYSRSALNNIVTPFFWAVCFFFLFRGLRTRRPVDWVLAGLAVGLGEYGYFGNRLLPLLLLAFGAYLLVVHWRQGWRYLGHFGLLALGYFAAFGPQLAFFRTFRPELYFGRGVGMLTWDHIPRDWPDVQSMWNTLWPLVATNLRALVSDRSVDGVYWSPWFVAGEAALVALGVALLVWQWRHPAAFLTLMAGLGVLFVGGTLTRGTGVGPPFLAHWTPVIPSLFAAAAVPVGAWAVSWGRAGRAWPRAVRLAGPAFLAAGLALVVGINLNYYYRYYVLDQPAFEGHVIQSRWAAGLGPGTRVYTVGRTWQAYDPTTLQYLVAGQEGAALANPSRDLPLPGAPGKGLAFAFYTDNAPYRAVVEAFYPGGTAGEAHSSDGAHLFDTYTLTPAQVDARYGVHLQVRESGGATAGWEGQVPAVGDIPAAVTHFPLVAQWSGALYIAAAGAYQFNIATSGYKDWLWLDGQAAVLPVTQTLAAGWHRFAVGGVVNGPQALPLLVGPAGGSGAAVPQAQFWSEPWGQGLLGTTVEDGATPVTRVDPLISFSAITTGPYQPGQGPNSPPILRARWVGQLVAPQTGAYLLEIRTDGTARLALDDQPTVAACPPGSAASITLTAGPHALQLDFAAHSGQKQLELFWTTPAGQHALIPAEALRYMAPTDTSPPPAPTPPTDVPCGGP